MSREYYIEIQILIEAEHQDQADEIGKDFAAAIKNHPKWKPHSVDLDVIEEN